MAKAMKKGTVSPSPVDPTLMKAWNMGFNQGVKQQRESDIENLVTLLEGLEDIPGIGDKTASKIRMFLLQKFKNWSEQK
jgi:nucleotidyltransferase/DNA polymerase involved in DNA repair